MRAMTADDHRVKLIHELMNVHGAWCSEIEAAVCQAMDSAFDDGMGSVGTNHARYRILRWLVRHDGDEGGATHEAIAEACGTARETVTRHLGALRRDGALEGSGRLHRQSFRLTALGRDLAASMDSLDLRGRAPESSLAPDS